MTREEILARIANLSDLQIRNLMARVFVEVAKNQGSKQIHENLIAERDYWKKLYEDKTPLDESCVDIFLKTIKTYSDFFESLDSNRSESDKMQPALKQKLQTNGIFANYIAGFISNNSGNPGQIARVVYLFCDYLCRLSVKDKIEQEQYLQSFPIPEDLNCLGGTEERLETILKRIDANYKFTPFLDAHERVIRSNLESLKYYVREGNQVHIPDYLNYSLGIIDRAINDFIKLDIPFAKAFEIQADYAKKFKRVLIDEFNDIFNSRSRNLEEIKENLFIVFSDHYLQKDHNRFISLEVKDGFFAHIQNSFKDYIGDQNCVVEESEDEKSKEVIYTFDQDLLNQSITNIPALKIIETLPQVDPASQYGFFSQNSGAELAKILHSKDGAQRVYNTLLAYENSSPQEIIYAVEALWMLGEKFSSNSPIQFVSIIKSLNAIEENFIEKRIRPIVQEHFPNQLNKVDKLQSLFAEYSNLGNEVFSYSITPAVSTSATASNEDMANNGLLLFSAIEGNAPLELVLNEINSIDSFLIDSEFEALNNSSFINPSGQFSKIVTQASQRPDADTIFSALSTKASEIYFRGDRKLNLQGEFLGNCFLCAAQSNNNLTALSILENFEFNAALKESIYIPALFQAIDHDNVDLFRTLFARECCVTSDILNYRFDGIALINLLVDKNKILEEIKKDETFARDLAERINQHCRTTGSFPLIHEAAKQGKSNFIKFCCEIGVDINLITSLDDQGESIVAHACENGYSQVIRVLSDLNFNQDFLIGVDDYDVSNLEMAIYGGHKGCVEALLVALQKIPEVNLIDIVNGLNLTGKNPPIHVAAESDKPEIIELLHQFGADLNKENSSNKSTFEIAIKNKSYLAAVKLINLGASFDLNNRADDFERIKGLIDNGLNAMSLLKDAAQRERQDLFTTLSNEVAASYILGGKTFAHLAVERSDIEALQILKEKGVNLENLTELAFEKGNSKIIEFFNSLKVVSQASTTANSENSQEELLDLKDQDSQAAPSDQAPATATTTTSFTSRLRGIINNNREPS